MNELHNADIQGLVISGYGHLYHGHYLFLRFNDAEGGRKWVADMIPQIATGARWPKDDQGKTIKPDHMINIGLSCYGLGALGMPEASQATFPHEFRQGIAHPDRQRILGDTGENAPVNWEVGGDNAADVHAIIVVLAVSEAKRTQIYEGLKAGFAANDVTLIHEDVGDKLADSREHFGFFDGLSQPRLTTSNRDDKQAEPTIAEGEFVLGYKNEYGQLPFSPMLDGQDLGKNGTYVVFRKMHQDVAAFWNFIAANIPEAEGEGELATMTDDEKTVWLAAKLMGRWPSGVPLVMAPWRDNASIPQDQWNNFMFHDRDPYGDQCPFGSHVRRMNPRDSLPPTKEEGLKTADRHLLIRRGLPYGAPLFPLDQLPPPADIADDGVDRGLIFLAINANISRQFEFVQQSWVENTHFHGLYNEKDPIIGNANGTTEMTLAASPVRRTVKKLQRFVTIKGGGYFFMPSISALGRIATMG